MKKSIVLFCFCVFLGKLLIAQGIVFETGTWDEALRKAKEENKVLFVDIYTSWCAPCKVVAKNVFPQEKVGNYYNQHFINYQLDGEKGDGPAVAKKYNVSVYPTFLFLNGDGELLYRFSGAKDAKGFLEEADKVSICAKFGGWDKMQEDYKTGNGGPDLLWAYYELVGKDKKAEVLNKYLKSLPDEKLFTIEVAKMMDEDIQLYDYDLMKRIVEGRVKLGEQSEDFDFFFTFGSQMLLTRFLNQSIEKGDEKWFKELLELKKKYNELPRTSDPDINMAWGRGAFFASVDFLNLHYMGANENDDELFAKSLEAYMEKLMRENPLDSVAKGRETSVKILEQNPSISFIVRSLMDGNKLIAQHIINFTDYYWRVMPSNKATRERCAAWANYACNLNPYNPEAPLKAADLLYRLNHKKDVIHYLERMIEKQKKFQGDPQKLSSYDRDYYAKSIKKLESKLRDVKNDKI